MKSAALPLGRAAFHFLRFATLLSGGLLGFSSAPAQTSFSKTLWHNPSYLTANAIVPAWENGYTIVGINKGQKGILFHLDTLGIPVWNRIFDLGISNVYPNLNFHTIQRTYDSCYFVSGEILETATNQLNGILLKFSRSGALLWNRVIAVPNASIRFTSTDQTPDSGYVVTGQVQYPSKPYDRILVVRTDASGTVQWSYEYSGGSNDNRSLVVKTIPDSTLLIGGYMEDYPPINTWAFVAALSPAGNPLWTKRYQPAAANATPYVSDLLVRDGSIFAYLNMNTGDPVSLMKLDTGGNLQWVKSYNMAPNHSSWYNILPVMKIRAESDSTFWMASGTCGGGSSMVLLDSSGSVLNSASAALSIIDMVKTGPSRYFIIGNGPLCGVKTTSSVSDHVGIIQTDSLPAAGNCLGLAGYFASLVAVQTSSFSPSYNPVGIFNSSILNADTIYIMDMPGCVAVLGPTGDLLPVPDWSLFPNPATDHLVIECRSESLKLLIIYDLSGRCLIRRPLEGILPGSILRQPLALRPGTYVAEIQTAGGSTGRRLFICSE